MSSFECPQPSLNTSDELLVKRDAEVLTLRLNRPRNRNALGQNLCRRLFYELSLAKTDNSVKVVILTGSEKVFCSGHDLAELSLPSSIEGDPGLRFVRELAEFPKPIIAAVHGPAIGVGFALLLHCDFVYVSQSALLSAPFIRLGIGPQFGMSYLLPRRIGESAANQVLLLGKSIDAVEAVGSGIAHAVVAEDAVALHAIKVACELASFSLPALIAMKQSLKGSTHSIVLETIDREAQAFSRLHASPESKAMLMAALQKH
jgi:enoyl-CoA hydratase/carnithine racemase